MSKKKKWQTKEAVSMRPISARYAAKYPVFSKNSPMHHYSFDEKHNWDISIKWPQIMNKKR